MKEVDRFKEGIAYISDQLRGSQPDNIMESDQFMYKMANLLDDLYMGMNIKEAVKHEEE